MALAQVGSAGRGRRLIVVLEDRLLRESLAMALAEEGFRPLEFAHAEPALTHIEAGSDVDALIVEAAPGDAGATGNHDRPRDRLRAARCASPVFVLSGDGEALAAADTWGAAGVVDRTQPLAKLKRNLVNAIRASALLAAPAGSVPVLSHGPLVIGAAGARVSWKGCYLDLGAAERALLAGLVGAPAPGLTIQRAQAILADLDENGSGGAGSGAGGGSGGSAERVKSLVRRLRKKFREVDPEFDQIVFVPGCGYGWRGGNVPTGSF